MSLKDSDLNRIEEHLQRISENLKEMNDRNESTHSVCGLKRHSFLMAVFFILKLTGAISISWFFLLLAFLGWIGLLVIAFANDIEFEIDRKKRFQKRRSKKAVWKEFSEGGDL